MDIEEIGTGVEVPQGQQRDINKALVFPKNGAKHTEGVDECKSTVPGTQRRRLELTS